MRSFSFAVVAAAFSVSLIASTTEASSMAARRDRSQHAAVAVQFERRDAKTAKYPAVLQTPPQSSLPQAWVDALNELEQQGKIPDIPVSHVVKTGSGIAYPSGTDMSKVCSWTIQKCFGENDIHTAPDNHWHISFDDGPTAVSTGLYDFLHQHDQAGSHFMIGSQIVAYKDAAVHASETNQQLAVHTWSHSLQTTKDNMAVLGELGWTMQIIYDLTGRVPNVWRPPQGDIDDRVRAIAEGVFNLTAVMWNAECNDWCIEDNGKTACEGENPGETQASVVKAINKAMARSKSPGVMLLEHELNKYSVGFFEQYYPTLASKGWTPLSVPDSIGMPWYGNAQSNDDTPINVTSMVYADVVKAVNAANATSTSNKKTTVGGTVKDNSSSSSSSSSSNALSQSSGVDSKAVVFSAVVSTFVGVMLAVVVITLA